MSDRYSPEQRREYMRAYYAKRLAEAKAILGGRCYNCGANKDLHIDHIDPRTKNMPVTSMLMGAKSAWLMELKKCQLLCVPCHVNKSNTERKIACLNCRRLHKYCIHNGS